MKIRAMERLYELAESSGFSREEDSRTPAHLGRKLERKKLTGYQKLREKSESSGEVLHMLMILKQHQDIS